MKLKKKEVKLLISLLIKEENIAWIMKDRLYKKEIAEIKRKFEWLLDESIKEVSNAEENI